MKDDISQCIDEIDRIVIEDIRRHEKQRAERAEWIITSAEGMELIPMHFNDKARLLTLDKTAKFLATHGGRVTRRVLLHGREVMRVTKSGLRLMGVCNFFDAAFMARHSQHAFNPWIEKMIIALGRWHPGHRFEASHWTISADDVKLLGRMARFVRLACRSRAFKDLVKKDQQLALQDYRSGRDYIMSLFAHHSRLLILRIDLYYCGEGRDTAFSEEARDTFERFLRTLRRGAIAPGVLGSLFSREVGAQRGAHYHVMVFMDGHEFKDADGYTREIGERWIKDYAGPGRGTYFNCYSRRKGYQYNGLGLVHASEWRKLMGVRLALEYMTKPEYLIMPKKDGRKNFRRGLIKNESVKMGAPRQSEHDLSTAWRVFGPSDCSSLSKLSRREPRPRSSHR